MRRQVTIQNEPIWLDDSLAWLLVFKGAFDEDALFFLYDELPKLIPVLVGELPDVAALDTQFLLRVFWAMAKNADPNFTDPDTYFQAFEVFPIGEILEALTDMLYRSSVFVSKHDRSDGDGTKPTTAVILAAGLRAGLTIADASLLRLSDWLEVLDAMLGGDSSKDTIREATQADFDAFARM